MPMLDRDEFSLSCVQIFVLSFNVHALLYNGHLIWPHSKIIKRNWKLHLYRERFAAGVSQIGSLLAEARAFHVMVNRGFRRRGPLVRSTPLSPAVV